LFLPQLKYGVSLKNPERIFHFRKIVHQCRSQGAQVTAWSNCPDSLVSVAATR
jgi:hypothetical protein